MQFFGGTTLEDFIDTDVHVILTSKSEVCDTLPLCRAFMYDGKLCLDLIPQLNRKYVVEVPDDSVLSRNDEELAMGRYGIVISEDSDAGRIIREMLEQKRRMQKG